MMTAVLLAFILNYFVIETHSIYTVDFPIVKLTSQSKTVSKGWPHLALDKDINTCSIAGGNLTMEMRAWWRVELDEIYDIANVTIANNPRTSYVHFLSGLNIHVSMNNLYYEQHLCASIPVAHYTEDQVTASCREPATGKFVTITRTSGIRSDLLVLCEVFIQIKRYTASKSFKRPTSQSGILFTEQSSLAVDENKRTCARIRTQPGEEAWWKVDLDDFYDITDVEIYFRPDLDGSLANVNLAIYVSSHEADYQQQTCVSFFSLAKISGDSIAINCTSIVSGKYVILKWVGREKARFIRFCEVYVYSREKPFSVCKADEFSCAENLCLPKMKICDDIQHCLDGSDELNCLCDTSTDYRCSNGKCINKLWLCDGVKDCPTGDDEFSSNCDRFGDPIVLCNETQIRCERQICIDKDKRCNGVYDCQNNSDERNCLERNDMTREMQSLRATFKGETGYYICETNWRDRFSLLACKEMGFDMHDTSKFSKEIVSKSIGLINNKNFNPKLPLMAYFEIKTSCKTNRYVGLLCHQLTHESCGTRGYPDDKLQTYIVNGNEAKEGAWPWHVQVRVRGQFNCGGSLIRNDIVLTAAHCLRTTTNESAIEIKVGTNVRDDPMVKSQSVSQFTIHPNYKHGSVEYDIALIKLRFPVQSTNVIRTICLPNKSLTQRELMAHGNCAVSGFGDRAEGLGTKYLRQGKMNILTDSKCARDLNAMTTSSYQYYLNLLQNKGLFCTGTRSSRVNICSGDSGGPLACTSESGRWVQIGVINFGFEAADGYKCANNVFARVDYHLSFIHSFLQGI